MCSASSSMSGANGWRRRTAGRARLRPERHIGCCPICRVARPRQRREWQQFRSGRRRRSSFAAPSRRAGRRWGRCPAFGGSRLRRAGRCRARGQGPSRCVRGRAHPSVPNCSAITKGEWLGSMMPPEPTRMVFVAAAIWPMTTLVAALAMPLHTVMFSYPVTGEAQTFHMDAARSAALASAVATLPP